MADNLDKKLDEILDEADWHWDGLAPDGTKARQQAKAALKELIEERGLKYKADYCIWLQERAVKNFPPNRKNDDGWLIWLLDTTQTPVDRYAELSKSRKE